MLLNKKMLEDYQSYEAYLRYVVDNLPPDYLESAEPNVNDILARYQTLTETAQSLKDDQKSNSTEITRLQNCLSEMGKVTQIIILQWKALTIL